MTFTVIFKTSTFFAITTFGMNHLTVLLFFDALENERVFLKKGLYLLFTNKRFGMIFTFLTIAILTSIPSPQTLTIKFQTFRSSAITRVILNFIFFYKRFLIAFFIIFFRKNFISIIIQLYVQ